MRMLDTNPFRMLGFVPAFAVLAPSDIAAQAPKVKGKFVGGGADAALEK